MEKRITLFKRGRSWFARWNGPDQAMVQEIFGTNELVTCYTVHAPASEVLEAIQGLNKDYNVGVEVSSL